MPIPMTGGRVAYRPRSGINQAESVSYYLDATTATIENPLSVGGQWQLSGDTTNFLTGGRIATMTGGVKGIVGDTGSSFNDDVSYVTGSSWLENQYVWAKFYVNGSLGNYEHELHTNSQSTGAGDQKCYAVSMIAATTFQLGKWTGPFREIGSSTKGPIILRSQVALPAVMVTGDWLGLFSEKVGANRRLRCIYRPAAAGSGGPWDSVGGSDTVVLDFTDDGTNTGSSGGDAPENRDPDADGTPTNNTAPINGGAPGVGFDNSFTEVLNGGYTEFRAVTKAP